MYLSIVNATLLFDLLFDGVEYPFLYSLLFLMKSNYNSLSRTYIHTHISTHTYISTHHTLIYIHIHIHIYTYTYICMHVLYIYIHTRYMYIVWPLSQSSFVYPWIILINVQQSPPSLNIKHLLANYQITNIDLTLSANSCLILSSP
jgi:hypothetical protein